MYSLIQILIAFPRLIELFKKLNDELLLEMDRREFNRNAASIDEWMRNGKTKPSASTDTAP